MHLQCQSGQLEMLLRRFLISDCATLCQEKILTEYSDKGGCERKISIQEENKLDERPSRRPDQTGLFSISICFVKHDDY